METFDATRQGANTAFDYMYRDASNNKASKRVILEGRLSPDDVAKVVASLEDDTYFIPGQVGLTDLQGEFRHGAGWDEDDDHVWHTIEEIEYTDSRPHSEADTKTVEALMADWPAKDDWDVEGHTARLSEVLPTANRI